MHYITNIKYINHSFINVSYNLTKFMRRNLTHKFNLVHAWSRDESISSSAIGSKIRRTGSRPVNRLPIRFAWDKKCTKKYTRETQGENWKEWKTRFPVRFAYVGKRDLSSCSCSGYPACVSSLSLERDSRRVYSWWDGVRLTTIACCN